ncbi:MAG: CsgG/HfaB family protein [Selenomonadaceae bacterium]
MKRILENNLICKYGIRLLFFIGFLFLFTPIGYASQQKSIGVLTFKNLSGQRGLEQLLSDSLMSELSKNPKLNVIDRDDLAALLNEQSLSRMGLLAKNNAAQMGRISGISYLVTGSISDSHITDQANTAANKKKINIMVFWKVLDTTSGSVVFADTINGSINKVRVKNKRGQKIWKATFNEYTKSAEDVSKKISDILDKNLNESPISVHIASIDGNIVYIDAGANKEVIPGQVFTVYKDGKAVCNPETGEVLGLQHKLVCQITITSVENKMSLGTVTSGEIRTLKIGDCATGQ